MQVDLEAICTCGHAYEEHRIDMQGVHECAECDCDGFDEDDEE